MMMKHIPFILPALCCCALLAACRTAEETPQTGLDSEGRIPVTLAFSVGDVCYGTRSTTVSDESGIRNLNLFLYRGGKLEWQEYRTAADPISLNLLAGESYSAYALANVGRREAPAAETALHDYGLDLSGSGAAGKIPMATRSGMPFVVPASGPTVTVPVTLTRLVAKYNFQVDRSGLQYGSFTLTSVRVRQAANRVDAFATGSAAASAGEVADGDYASEADLGRLNADAPVCFYLPENAQGTLLSGNTDPWRKEYFDPSVAARAPLCTYLEVKGRYRDRSGGLGATHTYRMYLGEDATTNFDVLRNTEYTLTLSVSDLGVFRESWKVERGDVTDSRTLRFEPSVLDIPSLGSAATAVVCSPSGVDYRLEWDESAFSAAALAAPAVSGASVTLSNETALDADATAVLRAVSFDGAVSAACTLRVSGGILPPLEPQWLGTAPAYVAQAGTVRVDNQSVGGGALSATSSDPSVARLVAQDGDFRVEALKAGSATLTFTQTVGARTRSGSLAVTVAPVYLQVAGQSYRAFADGASNARRIDSGAQEPWALSYDQPRSAFDDELYAELLTPSYTAVKSDSPSAVDYFEVSEEGLYVAGWGSDLAGLPGSYTLSLRPRADIYAAETQPLVRTVVVDAPIAFPETVFAGENRYYMPDPGASMSLLSSGNVSLSLGDPASLKVCVGFPTGGYGEGSGYVPCPYERVPGRGGEQLELHPSYADLESFFPNPYRFRGALLGVFAQLTNARSGQQAVQRLGSTEIWLCLAVTARLDCWPSSSDWDVLDDDHYYLVPCLYDERFENGLITFHAAEAGGSGDLSLPPYYLPRNLLAGLPDRETLGGATIWLSDEIPANRPHPDGQVSDYALGLRCPDVTLWLWDECGFEEEDYDCEAYRDLEDSVGLWYHRKLYWRLYDPRTATIIPDGGHLDITSYGGYPGNYYLRIYDYAQPLDGSDFED